MTGADNQQERLIRSGWVTGFVDGEGCFSVSFVRQPDRASRRGYKTGYQVCHRFVVTQGMKSLSTLEELREFFGVGRIFVNQRCDNHREPLAQYTVNKRVELREVVVPFFMEHPLRSAKRYDFERFAQTLSLVDAGHHRSREGMIVIAMLAESMNRQKPRTELIRILRDHTPDIRDIG